MSASASTGHDDADVATDVCFHCGERNPPGHRSRLVVDGVERRFCCAGCRGVAQTIHAAGLDAFYRRRDTVAAPVSAAADDEWTRDAVAADAAGLIAPVDAHVREISLLLEGIHCAACVWLSESWLQRQPGVVAIGVNHATHRARLRWDSRVTSLPPLLQAIAAIGYRAQPYNPQRREALAAREQRALLTRMAIAAFAMMQVMMYALPAYVSTDGVDIAFQRLLDWASLLITVPVVLYCAAPFFAAAWRDLRVYRLGMDVPVALGIGVAFGASAWATASGNGAVYYDSVTMFVALLLTARYLELRTRHSAGDMIETLACESLPTAERLAGYPASTAADIVVATALSRGDFIRVAAGAVIPADGTVIDGRSSAEEALLTGESRPRSKAPGDRVLAGSLNRESLLIVQVSAAGEATTLAAIARMVERASLARPRAARLADQVARWFVAALLVIAAATALYWALHDPARALATTLAVLVVSCPCALSLATPAAVAAAAGALGRRGVFAVRSDALEALAKVTHVVFDKTGTLTYGHLRLAGVRPTGKLDPQSCLDLAGALEEGCAHPVATALRAARSAQIPSPLQGTAMVSVQGSGVEGVVAGKRYRCGRLDWVAEIHGAPPPVDESFAEAGSTIVGLAGDDGWLALFAFGDCLRPGVVELVAGLRRLGIAVSLVSGDGEKVVRHVASAVGIAEFRGNARPDDKQAVIRAYQRDGAVVAMIGDGVNDTPGLAQADVSLSFGSAAALTQWTADFVAIGDDPQQIGAAFGTARKTFRVIRQNLVWAGLYNAIAIPLAATGHIAPLVAALGMSISSLLVIANAQRLTAVGRVKAPGRPAPARPAPLAAR